MSNYEIYHLLKIQSICNELDVLWNDRFANNVYDAIKVRVLINSDVRRRIKWQLSEINKTLT